MNKKLINEIKMFLKVIYGENRLSNNLKYCVEVALSNINLGYSCYNEYFCLFGLTKDEYIEEIIKSLNFGGK